MLSQKNKKKKQKRKLGYQVTDTMDLLCYKDYCVLYKEWMEI